MRQADSLPEVCAALTEGLAQAGFALPSVYLLVDGRLRCQAALGYYQVVDGFFPGVGIIGRCVVAGQELLIADVTADPSFIAAVPGIRSEACVPVLLAGKVVGAVNVESHDELPADTLQLLHEAAAALGDWLAEHGGLPEVPLAERLGRISLQLASSRDIDDILATAAAGAADLSRMGSGMVARRREDASWSRRVAGPLSEALDHWSDRSLATMSGWVSAGTSSHFPGGQSAPAGYEFLVSAGVHALSVQPMVAGGEVFGLLIAAGERPGAHDPAVGVVLELLAAQTAAALGMAEAMAQLQIRAVQDALTGLPNASAFATDLQAATNDAALTQSCGRCLLLLDLDNFKAINDTYGHLAGDGLLVALARELTGELRGTDKLYRIGGDEFAVLVTVQDPSEAAVIGARLVEAARRVRTTISVGAAMLDGTDGLSVRSFADIALYQAKAAGRDRAHVAATTGPTAMPAASTSPRKTRARRSDQPFTLPSLAPRTK